MAAGAVGAYHTELVARLAAVLGPELVGVYAGGSFALGDFDGTRSDVDVAAVSRGGLDDPVKDEIVRALRHEALPVPARGLELVLYSEQAVRIPRDDAAFELNLNTGPAIAFRVDYEPGTVERFWFPVDRAILAERGVALHGPPAPEMFAPIPRSLLLPVVRESLDWHLRRDTTGDADAVLNACRALRYVVGGTWSSKGEAGMWARERVGDRALVEEALRKRRRPAGLDRARVERLVESVLAAAREH